ncbi:MAG: branched-chain amino acid ABC transporter permease [Xanthobacteraceae bacterium]
MDPTIIMYLVRDGVTTGAIYALLGVALVLVFAATRVIFIPQGEFVAFSALSLVAFEDGRTPGIAPLLVVLGVFAAASRLYRARQVLALKAGLRILGVELLPPLVALALVRVLAPMKLGGAVSVPLTIVMVIQMGAVLYRIVFLPLAEASVLVLLIAAFAVHMILVGLGLYFFGPEGFRTGPYADVSLSLGALNVNLQDIVILVTAFVAMAGLWWFFATTRSGKALRASAVNRVGASLVGIPTQRAGQIAFGLAAALGAISGALIAPVTTIYYDIGFVIGLKGLVAAVLGGLASYPLTVLAAFMIAGTESAASFWASGYKEVIVFLLIVPVLLWRSLVFIHVEADEE